MAHAHISVVLARLKPLMLSISSISEMGCGGFGALKVSRVACAERCGEGHDLHMRLWVSPSALP